MYQDEVVLCGSSAYTKKFYLNEDFSNVGGTLQLVFSKEGSLVFRTDSEENDFMYDEIGSVLKIKQLQQTRQELLEALEMFYKVFFLGEEFEEDQGCY